MQLTEYIHALKMPFQVRTPLGTTVPRFVYTYLVYGKKISVIDSGVASSENAILDYLKKTGRHYDEISTLILTHSHPDHIGAAKAIKEISGCSVASHSAERAWIEDVNLQAKERPVPGFETLVGGSVQVDCILEDGDVIDLCDGLSLQVIHTPGHSPGSISLWFPKERALFSADAIPITGDMPIYQDILASSKSIQRLKSIDGVKLLLAAWDSPRAGSEATRIMQEGLDYLQRIHNAVLKVEAQCPGLDSMELCRRVLREVGLSETMANPLVARSFQSSLRFKDLRILLSDQIEGYGENEIAYEDEDQIIWLKGREDLAMMDYVREKFQYGSIRTGPVKSPEGEILIGYSVLKKTAKIVDNKGYCRRIFTLKPEDRYYAPFGAFQKNEPPEAVDPLSVQAGKPSRRIDKRI